ncbi:MAG: RIP metalloprotease RseP [Candidatus Omnitrophica bacterium]|nr:RIP metalloprotease RseP [Candidatus Omnitrophota bacterium]HOX54251.1 RIP metalloprotease RseP [Candidatus Omnitrophota bacterium]
MSFLIFIIVISILIVIHEFGHFIVAKSLGIRVEKFVLGFGPQLLTKKRNDTEYAIALIPFGGYVKMSGDTPDEFRGNKWEYFSRPPGQRAKIVLFGPVLNYVLAFVCFCLVFFIGFPTLGTEVGELMDGFPGKEAGLLSGDKITNIDGKKVNNWEELQKIVFNKKEGKLDLIILRANKEIKISILPKRDTVKNIFGQEEKVSLIGIKPKEEFVQIKYPLGRSIVEGAKKLLSMTGLTYKALYMMLTGGMSFKESVTGPLGMFFITSKAMEEGIAYLIYVMAILSMSLAIFNLIPFPVLDGGHLFLLALEKIRGKRLSQNIDDWINRVGLGLIVFMALFVFYNDLIRYGIIDKIVGFVSNIK